MEQGWEESNLELLTLELVNVFQSSDSCFLIQPVSMQFCLLGMSMAFKNWIISVYVLDKQKLSLYL